MTFPQLFLLGAPKCATTSLYDLLKAHDHLVCPEVKEPGYFTRHEVRADIVAGAPHLQDEAGYRALYAGAGQGGRIGCDASTSYLRFRPALEAIAALGPEVKAVAVYRDPVELVSSYHLFLLNEAWEDQARLEDAWALQDQRRRGAAIPPGARRPSALVYADVAQLGRQIAAAQEILGPRLRLYEMRELTRETARVSAEIQDWLGLPQQDLGALPVSNAARQPRLRALSALVKSPPPPIRQAKALAKRLLGTSSLGIARRVNALNEQAVTRTVSDEMRAELRAYFLEDVQLLEQLVGRDLRADWGWA